MKFTLLLFATFALTFNLSAQLTEDENETKATYFSQASSFYLTNALRDLPAVRMEWEDGRVPTISNKLRRNLPLNKATALPQGDDPLWQKTNKSHINKAPLQNWTGSVNVANPPDPSGAAGPNYYIQMVNSEFAIYNKVGTILYGPTTLGSLLGGSNDGDPIVMYDQNADRWFLSQFKTSNNSLQIAVSETPDPTGAYYTYEFPLGSNFPDYPKYSIWNDGYYVTSNKSGDQCYALERDKMLIGDPSAQIVGFTIPQIETNGFFSALSSNATNGIVTPGTPNYLYYFQDDSWANVSQDHIKIWEVSPDWVTIGNSTISTTPLTVNVSPFDSEFTQSWNDIEQPGTSQKIDGVPGAFMYMAQYREFSGYKTVVLNHTVDVDGTNHGGIRWYELRKVGANPWTLYQEGTFAPDAESRFIGSICMDYQGNIGLAYSVSGPTVYPSLRYTGRYYYDPLGQMTLAEEDIIVGGGVKTGSNRWGDYAQMTIDPDDDATFWHTGQFADAGDVIKTQIASFKIALDLDNNVGVASVNSPVDGALTATEIITITVANPGVNSQSNFPVSYTIDGGLPVTETFPGPLASGTSAQFSFTQTVDMSTTGYYDIVAYTGLIGDQYNPDDTTFYTVKHEFSNDVGISNITAPTSNTGLSAAEVVTVTLYNYGTVDQSNFPVSYTLNGGSVNTETYNSTLAAGANTSFSFAATVDLSALGTFNFIAYTDLVGDEDTSNDTIAKEVIHEMCLPTGDCSFGTGIFNFELGTIANASNCSSNGFGDHTSMSTILEQSATYNLTLKSGLGTLSGTVWIDFNDNFAFESNEIVKQDMAFSATNTTETLTIDANATLGQHLLRVKSEWNTPAPSVTDPCTAVSYGETEDYMVDVISFTGVDDAYQNFDLIVATLENGKFTLRMDNINEPVSIEVHNTVGQKVYHKENIQTGTSLNHTIDISENASGYYLIKVGNGNFSKVKKIMLK